MSLAELKIGDTAYMGTPFALNRLERYHGGVVFKEHSTYYGNRLRRAYDLQGNPKALYLIEVEYRHILLLGIVGESLDNVKRSYKEYQSEVAGE